MEVRDETNMSSDHLFALVYGGSGTGKTHLMGTLGELGSVLVIDVDQGAKTITHAKGLQQYRNNIVISSFDRFKDLDTAYKMVDRNTPEGWNSLFGTPGLVKKPFDWIVWDTWSELQWFLMQQLREENSRLGAGLTFRKNIEIQHWGQMTDLNKLSVEALRACKVNQVFVMQETMTKDDLSGQIFGGPAIHGKMVGEMPTYFDIVVHTYTDIMGKFCATTKGKGKWAAKTRISEGQDFINPTAKELFQ